MRVPLKLTAVVDESPTFNTALKIRAKVQYITFKKYFSG